MSPAVAVDVHRCSCVTGGLIEIADQCSIVHTGRSPLSLYPPGYGTFAPSARDLRLWSCSAKCLSLLCIEWFELEAPGPDDLRRTHEELRGGRDG
jgi:hypothetical protein